VLRVEQFGAGSGEWVCSRWLCLCVCLCVWFWIKGIKWLLF